MLRCIAIDDEPLALGLLVDNISKVPFLQLVACCSDAFEATKALQEQAVDLVFIDIQMPGLTGLQFIESLTQRPMVIMVTAYKQFALEGYSLDVVDYLVKPVPMERFLKACNKALALYELKREKKNPEAAAPGYFFVPADYSMVKIDFDDLLWVEGLRDYVKLHLRSGSRPMISRTSMTGIEKSLPPARFIRIHKSYIVAIKAIHSIRRNSIFIGELELPIGETYKEAVQQLLGEGGAE